MEADEIKIQGNSSDLGKANKMEKCNNSEQPEMHRVLELALEAGCILLKNGAEIFRVEETIWHICNRYHIEQMDAFVLSNGIFLTAHQKGEENFARVKYVPLAKIHLGIVTEVNALSREIAAGKLNIDEAFARLEEIEKMPPRKDWQLILASGLSCGSFCYLTHKNTPTSCMAFAIGIILYMFLLLARRYKLSKLIINIVGGGLITVLALIATSLPLPFNVGFSQVIIGSIVPLIPGMAFVNSIRDIADSDFISGIVRMLDALLVFVYIAVGVGCVLIFYEQVLGGIIR